MEDPVGHDIIVLSKIEKQDKRSPLEESDEVQSMKSLSISSYDLTSLEDGQAYSTQNSLINNSKKLEEREE